VAMFPDWFARAQFVTGDNLVVPALLLGVEKLAADREGRPSRTDRPAPHLHRRRHGPISPDPHAVNDAVAAASAKAGPIGACFRCSSRRNRRRLTAGLSQELFFGSLRPPPM